MADQQKQINPTGPTGPLGPCHHGPLIEPEKSKKRSPNVGVGMPQYLYLEEFGSHLWSVFGHPAYLVGSALFGKKWRDVDVRLLLPDDEYAAWGFGDPNYPTRNAKLVAITMAFAALGKQMTGLPIDFQLQPRSYANEKFNESRSALGVTDLRISDSPPDIDPKVMNEFEEDMKGRPIPDIVRAVRNRRDMRVIEDRWVLKDYEHYEVND